MEILLLHMIFVWLFDLLLPLLLTWAVTGGFMPALMTVLSVSSVLGFVKNGGYLPPDKNDDIHAGVRGMDVRVFGVTGRGSSMGSLLQASLYWRRFSRKMVRINALGCACSAYRSKYIRAIEYKKCARL